MRITFNNQIYEIDDDLLKISDSLKWISEGKQTEDEPIPLQKCTTEIFEIFMKWFNLLKKEGIEPLPKNLKISLFVYEYDLFIDYDINILFKLLEFGFVNQIELLTNTIAYVIYKNFKIKTINNEFYIMHNKQTNINNSKIVKSYDFVKIPVIYKNIIEQFKTKKSYNYNKLIMKILQIPNISILEFNGEDNFYFHNVEIDEEDDDEYIYDKFYDVILTDRYFDFEFNPYFIIGANDSKIITGYEPYTETITSKNIIKHFTKNSNSTFNFNDNCLKFIQKFVNLPDNLIMNDIKKHVAMLFGDCVNF